MWWKRCNPRSILFWASRRWISTKSSSASGGRGKRFAAVWGNGDFGRLGLGTSDSQWTPSACTTFLEQHHHHNHNHNHNLISVSCGGAHTLFLTESGRVYATGINDFGQLGISDKKAYTVDPLEVFGLPKEITQIATGYHHSAAITVDGELYMWGNNSSGQLGLGKNSEKVVSAPSKVGCLEDMRIKKIALGSEHSIAITEDGEALSWGSGGSGRLGHGHQSSYFGFLRSTSEYTPRLIKELEGIKVKTVSAGILHSVCISENGSVFLFGEKTVNKLGFGESKNATSPYVISELPMCEEVACGGYHTCVVTKEGDLYSWGSNENGCLGTGSSNVVHLPQRVEGPFLELHIKQISCGWKHTAAVSDGNVFTWGWGGSNGTFSVDGLSSGGQLGHGDDIDYFEPKMVNFAIKNVKVVQVSCGFNHTGAILEYTS